MSYFSEKNNLFLQKQVLNILEIIHSKYDHLVLEPRAPLPKIPQGPLNVRFFFFLILLYLS